MKITPPPYRISDRIFTIGDIRKLAEVIEAEYLKTAEEADPDDPVVVYPPTRTVPTRKYILRSSDGTQYECDDAGVFAEGGRLYDKRIVYVEMVFENKDENKTISIRLEHGSDTDTNNVISVTGSQDIWVNGIRGTLEKIIGDAKPQVKFTKLRRFCMITLLPLVFAYLFTNTIVILTKLTEDAEWDSNAFWFLFLVFFIAAIYAMPSFVKRFENLYPRVELVTGPEHSRIGDVWKKRLWTAVAYILIPIGLTVLSEVLRWALR
ncbi:MAG: hypothetical protein AB1793_04590 [Candidatus Thermoplasmatota archaeon]